VKVNNPASAQAGLAFREFLAKSVKEYREKNGLSMMQFAAKADISRKKIGKVESKALDINTTDLCKIAAAMECQASQLLRVAGL
jgi:transcriptional regulator with XRE-family HTH domain